MALTGGLCQIDNKGWTFAAPRGIKAQMDPVGKFRKRGFGVESACLDVRPPHHGESLLIRCISAHRRAKMLLTFWNVNDQRPHIIPQRVNRELYRRTSFLSNPPQTWEQKGLKQSAHGGHIEAGTVHTARCEHGPVWCSGLLTPMSTCYWVRTTPACLQDTDGIVCFHLCLALFFGRLECWT